MTDKSLARRRAEAQHLANVAGVVGLVILASGIMLALVFGCVFVWRFALAIDPVLGWLPGRVGLALAACLIPIGLVALFLALCLERRVWHV